LGQLDHSFDRPERCGRFAIVGWFHQTKDYLRDSAIMDYRVRRAQRMQSKRRETALISSPGSHEPHRSVRKLGQS
jgi:hypothetical protein